MMRIKMFEREEEKEIYSEDNVEEFLESDEISASEEGFMIGYLAS